MRRAYRFSKNVFAFTMFFPIALAFHAQYEPEGSTWYKHGPRVMSHPATKRDTPYGRTPLFQIVCQTACRAFIHERQPQKTYPECVACCMMVAISCVRTFVGGYSPYTFQYACALLRAFATSTRKSGPIPEYTMPMLGQMTDTLSIIESSMRMDEDFFSVAMTMPLDATCRAQHACTSMGMGVKHAPLIPRLVVPEETAARACSICTSLPLGEKTVSE